MIINAFKWCLVRYFHSVYDHLTRITKADKDLARELHLKDIKFSVKSGTFIKLKNKILNYENKEKYQIYASIKTVKNMLIYY